MSGQVRVYDEATKTLQTTLSGGLGYQRVGHSNRVFSLKFCSQDDHMLLSAGWDNTVQVLLIDCLCEPSLQSACRFLAICAGRSL